MSAQEHPLAGFGSGAIAVRNSTVWRCFGKGFWGCLEGSLQPVTQHHSSLTWRSWVIAFPIPKEWDDR